MFCSKCGTKNEESAEFCTKCGEALNSKKEKKDKPQTNGPVNAGGLRKTMKRDAKKRVNGALVGATVVYFIAVMIISMIFTSTTAVSASGDNFDVLKFIGDLLTSLVGIVFGFGMLMVGFKAVRGETFAFKDVFTKPFENIKGLGYYVLLILLVFVISFVVGLIAIIPVIGWLIFIAFIIAIFYYIPAVEVFTCIVADVDNSKDLSFIDTIKKSLEIIKGHRVEFYGVTLSFIGWGLLGILTLGILYIWLIPYIQLTMVNLYRRWTSEETFTNQETGLSNGAVIGISIGGCGCGVIVLFTLLIGVVIAIISSLGLNANNPSVQSFIDKYVPTEDKAEVEANLNDLYKEIEDSQQ